MISTLQQFADAFRKKFAVPVSGKPEDQLRAPFERLQPVQGALLDDIVSGDKVDGDAPGPVPEAWRTAPKSDVSHRLVE